MPCQPLGQVDVEIVRALICVARGQIGQRTAPPIHHKDDALEQYDSSQRRGQHKLATGAGDGNPDDASDDEEPGHRVQELDSCQCAASFRRGLHGLQSILAVTTPIAAAMRFVSGARLGPFEILAPLGAGGMGEVYRARDTRLDRTVAIKLLPGEIVNAPGRRIERFRHEARAIARISHPNICTLHDVGEDGSAIFLVMEYVDGATLARRLEDGPLPLPVALRIAIQIADALDHAHRHGVVHRDLKPANIMLTRDSVKLLDFGLAKLRERDEQAPIEATTSERLTEADTIVRTVPEASVSAHGCGSRQR